MRILFIGTVNKGNKPTGGEEFKNQLILAKLEVEYEIVLIETSKWRTNMLVISKLFFHLFFIKYDQIIISASSLSTNRLLSLLYFFPKINQKIIYFVLGGYFPVALEKGVYQIDKYKNLKAIFIQGIGLKNKLLSLGLNNVFVLNNFKNFESTLIKTNYNQNFDLIKFVFISTLLKEKGVDLIIEAVIKLINKGFQGRFSVTFYGMMTPQFEKKFSELKIKEIEFKGYLDLMNNPQIGYDILAGYHCLIFPTYYKGEGFAGVFIDAFFAGLPVITTEWNMNSEVIKDGYNGIIIQPKDSNAIVSAI
jgi:glycosyltransferase involved in cell wall biosynthesis